MRGLKWTVIIGLLVSAGGAADAQTLVYSGTMYDVYVDVYSVGTVESLWAQRISVVNKSGNAGYDPHTVIANAGLGYTGITGILHQQGFGPGTSATLDELLNTPVATEIDTHWNVSGLAFEFDIAWENVDVFPSAEPVDAFGPFAGFAWTSYGTRLTGAFTDPSPSHGASWDVAWVVADEADPAIDMNVRIEGDLGGEDISVHLAQNLGILSDLGLAGPYVVEPGGNVTLQAVELAGIIPIEDYSLQWDLDDVGFFDDGTGAELTLDFDTLYAMLGPGTHAVGVYGELVDWPLEPPSSYYSARDVAYTTLTITPEPATMSLLALGGLPLLRRKRQVHGLHRPVLRSFSGGGLH